VAVLRKEGVDIARRTVAKYREALRIPSSVQRKREKAVPA
jgi:RNA polymerase sigma-54 factor